MSDDDGRENPGGAAANAPAAEQQISSESVKPRSQSLSSTILDYYTRYGQNRDLEKYFRYRSYTSETRHRSPSGGGGANSEESGEYVLSTLCPTPPNASLASSAASRNRISTAMREDQQRASARSMQHLADSAAATMGDRQRSASARSMQHLAADEPAGGSRRDSARQSAAAAAQQDGRRSASPRASLGYNVTSNIEINISHLNDEEALQLWRNSQSDSLNHRGTQTPRTGSQQNADQPMAAAAAAPPPKMVSFCTDKPMVELFPCPCGDDTSATDASSVFEGVRPGSANSSIVSMATAAQKPRLEWDSMADVGYAKPGEVVVAADGRRRTMSGQGQQQQPQGGSGGESSRQSKLSAAEKAALQSFFEDRGMANDGQNLLDALDRARRVEEEEEGDEEEDLSRTLRAEEFGAAEGHERSAELSKDRRSPRDASGDMASTSAVKRLFSQADAASTPKPTDSSRTSPDRDFQMLYRADDSVDSEKQTLKSLQNEQRVSIISHMSNVRDAEEGVRSPRKTTLNSSQGDQRVSVVSQKNQERDLIIFSQENIGGSSSRNEQKRHSVSPRLSQKRDLLSDEDQAQSFPVTTRLSQKRDLIILSDEELVELPKNAQRISVVSTSSQHRDMLILAHDRSGAVSSKIASQNEQRISVFSNVDRVDAGQPDQQRSSVGSQMSQKRELITLAAEDALGHESPKKNTPSASQNEPRISDASQVTQRQDLARDGSANLSRKNTPTPPSQHEQRVSVTSQMESKRDSAGRSHEGSAEATKRTTPTPSQNDQRDSIISRLGSKRDIAVYSFHESAEVAKRNTPTASQIDQHQQRTSVAPQMESWRDHAAASHSGSGGGSGRAPSKNADSPAPRTSTLRESVDADAAASGFKFYRSSQQQQPPSAENEENIPPAAGASAAAAEPPKSPKSPSSRADKSELYNSQADDIIRTILSHSNAEAEPSPSVDQLVPGQVPPQGTRESLNATTSHTLEETSMMADLQRGIDLLDRLVESERLNKTTKKRLVKKIVNGLLQAKYNVSLSPTSGEDTSAAYTTATDVAALSDGAQLPGRQESQQTAEGCESLKDPCGGGSASNSTLTAASTCSSLQWLKPLTRSEVEYERARSRRHSGGKQDSASMECVKLQWIKREIKHLVQLQDFLVRKEYKDKKSAMYENCKTGKAAAAAAHRSNSTDDFYCEVNGGDQSPGARRHHFSSTAGYASTRDSTRDRGDRGGRGASSARRGEQASGVDSSDSLCFMQKFVRNRTKLRTPMGAPCEEEEKGRSKRDAGAEALNAYARSKQREFLRYYATHPHQPSSSREELAGAAGLHRDLLYAHPYGDQHQKHPHQRTSTRSQSHPHPHHNYPESGNTFASNSMSIPDPRSATPAAYRTGRLIEEVLSERTHAHTHRTHHRGAGGGGGGSSRRDGYPPESVGIQTGDSLLRSILKPAAVQTGPYNVSYTITFHKKGDKPAAKPPESPTPSAQPQPSADNISATGSAGTNNSAASFASASASCAAAEIDVDQDPRMTCSEHLRDQRPRFLVAANGRRDCIREVKELRRERNSERQRVFGELLPAAAAAAALAARPGQEEDGDDAAELCRRLRELSAPRPLEAKRCFTTREMLAATRAKCRRLPEVTARADAEKLGRERRAQRLLKDVYGRKLQRRALRGEVNLSNSVEVSIHGDGE